MVGTDRASKRRKLSNDHLTQHSTPDPAEKSGGSRSTRPTKSIEGATQLDRAVPSRDRSATPSSTKKKAEARRLAQASGAHGAIEIADANGDSQHPEDGPRADDIVVGNEDANTSLKGRLENGTEEEAEDGDGALRASSRQRRRPKRYDEGDVIVIHTPTRQSSAKTPQSKTKKPSTRQPKVSPIPTARQRANTPPKRVRANGSAQEPASQDAPDDGEKQDDEPEDNPLTEAAARASHIIKPGKKTPRSSEQQRNKPSSDDNKDEDEARSVLPVREPLPSDLPQSSPRIITRWPGQPSQHAIIKRIVLGKITGKRIYPLIGLEEEYKKLHRVIEQTVMAGEGNSLLLIGARGTGKTALINAVLKAILQDNREDFHVIRLNGFIQTDDKIALREIWRQLGKEMDVEEDTQIKNYADTLATLLATLSHSSQLNADGNEEGRLSKSVVFILDEFDMFAAHPRQTLLYNLFDIAQSRKAPIAVLGVTTRVDVAESLEKRVKSRFSHRYIHLSLPKTLQSFREMLKRVLQVQWDNISFEERARLQTEPVQSEHGEGNGGNRLIDCWNKSVDDLFESPSFVRHVSRIYYTSKSLTEALTFSYLPVATLDDRESPYLTGASFSAETALEAPDSKLYLLESLPTLALALLIAAARLDVILDSDLCNFNMAYDEYSNLATRAKVSASASTGGVGIGGKVWGKEVAKEAWERLTDLKLLQPVAGLGGTGVSTSSDMVRCEVALEEIEGAVSDLPKGLEKWCREI